MKVLIFGPSGAGKTYISSSLRKVGINAVDADAVQGLSSWFDGRGNKVICPEDADEAFLDNHSFLWDKEFLKNYLKQNHDIYLFGSSGNIFEMLSLFDNVFFLHIDPVLQKERLQHESRENPMGNTEYQRENAVQWGIELEKKAKEYNISLLNASLTPQEIFFQLNG